MNGQPHVRLSTVVLGAPDPRTLAAFYQQILRWPIGADEDDWVTLRDPDSPVSLGFQREEGHVRPAWPAGSGEQQMQVHLDLEVDDLDEAIGFARSLGAVLAEYQPQDDVRVLLDPAGHPFCVWVR